MKNVINISEIRNEITGQHSIFVKEFGTEIDKIVAEHRLLSELAATKLKYILNVFTEEKIIDKIDEISTNTEPYKKIKLSKNNCENYIYLVTNGESIILTGSNYSVVAGVLDMPKKIFRDINEENFDWKTFAKELLSDIHSIIYERKEIGEARLKNVFKK